MWYANTTGLKAMERFQQRTTKWIAGYSDETCKERLVRLQFLPVCLYLEMHDVLLLSKIMNGNVGVRWDDKITFVQNTRTRYSSITKLATPRLPLTKSR